MALRRSQSNQALITLSSARNCGGSSPASTEEGPRCGSSLPPTRPSRSFSPTKIRPSMQEDCQENIPSRTKKSTAPNQPQKLTSGTAYMENYRRTNPSKTSIGDTKSSQLPNQTKMSPTGERASSTNGLSLMATIQTRMTMTWTSAPHTTWSTSTQCEWRTVSTVPTMMPMTTLCSTRRMLTNLLTPTYQI